MSEEEREPKGPGATLREARERDDRIVIGVVPLLYETDMQQDFDVVLVIDAPADLRVARLVEKRGLTAEEARAVTDA